MLISGSERSFELEGRAAAVALDFLGRFRRDLHQPARPGARGLVAELRLGVDDGGDQRGVDALFVGLLADHVLVVERQRQLLDRAGRRRPETTRATTSDHRQRPRRRPRRAGVAGASLLRFIPAASRPGRTAPARGPRPSRRSRPRARRARPSPPGSSWRASRSSTRAWPRAAARARRTSSAVTTATVVSKTPSISGLEQQRHLDHGDLGRPPAARASQAPIRSPTSGWICASSQVSCSGSAKTISPILAAVDAAVGRDLRPPALDQPPEQRLGVEQLVDDRVAGDRRRAQALESRQRLRLTGRDAAGEADRQRRHGRRSALLGLASSARRRRRPRRGRRASRRAPAPDPRASCGSLGSLLGSRRPPRQTSAAGSAASATDLRGSEPRLLSRLAAGGLGGDLLGGSSSAGGGTPRPRRHRTSAVCPSASWQSAPRGPPSACSAPRPA